MKMKSFFADKFENSMSYNNVENRNKASFEEIEQRHQTDRL